MSLALLYQQNLQSGGSVVNLAGSASAIATAAGALSDAKNLAAAAVANATASGTLSQAGALAGSAVDIASATGALSLAINLAGAAADQATATGSLSGTVNLASSAAAIATAVGTLAAGTQLAGAAAALATAAASLAEVISLGGAAQSNASSAAALTVAAAFSATPNANRTLQVSEFSSMGGAFRQQPDGIPVVLHSPVAVLDYTFDWQARHWLAPGESIASQSVTTESGIIVVSTNLIPVGSAAAVQIWLSGGMPGSTYLITCQIQTNTGRIDERSFRAMVMLR